MRRFLWLAVVLAGCTGAQEVASTTSVAPTTTLPEATTTTQPQTTTSTTQPTTTTTTLPPLTSLQYEEIGGFAFPVQAFPGFEEGILYVVEKVGAIRAVRDGEVLEEPVLDINERVRNSGEQGLLSATFHPEDPTRLFVHYSNNGGDTVVSEFRLDSPLSGDAGSERVLLEVNQPAGNHNGGMIQFDSRGALIVGLGDGGGANDRYGHGQNTDSLLGGLVAIDVDTAEPLLYAHGLRNPWRFWIEGERIFIADVGQNAYEEINDVVLEPGLNFGWPITEGLHCFRPSSGCDTDGLTLPVIEVAHGDGGTCSITGGSVYRGSLIPELTGHYLFSDYCGGYLRSYDTAADEVGIVDWTDDVGVPGRVTGFGVDLDGEVYVTTESALFRLIAIR